MSRKLMLVADEVVARQEMYHAKNKLKNLITGDWIRINPKHLASYRERNHVQVVFLSNEVQPAALERDDRRHAVIWTPPKHTEGLYHEVLREIAEGGIAALHHHLLHIDLQDFGPATLPPMTQAKLDLVEMGLDSSERFYNEWREGYLPLPRQTCRSDDLYAAYRHWCQARGESKPARQSTFAGTVAKRPGVEKKRCRHFKNYSLTVETQSELITPPAFERPSERADLSRLINGFAEALKTWREESLHAAGKPALGGKPVRQVGNGGPAPAPEDEDEPF
jgi:putative DNA primase/helicase